MGLLDPLYWIVAWVLVQFHSLWSTVLPEGSGAAWTLSIVGLVVVIRILLIPLFVKQIKAQRALQILQPEIKAIQKRFKDIGQEIFPVAQQNPAALASQQKTEIERWWPVIKAAWIKAE